MSTKSKKKNIIKNKVKCPVNGHSIKIAINSDDMTEFIDAALTVGSEFRLIVKSDMVSLNKVDDGNVLMLIASCKCESSLKGEEQLKFGINAEVLKKAMRFSKGSNAILHIDGENLTVNYGRIHAKIPLVNESVLRADPKGITIKTTTAIDMPGKYLHEICQFISGNGKCRIYTDNGAVFITAEEGDLYIREIVGTCDNDVQANSLFSNDYLKIISKIVKKTGIKVHLGNGVPTRILAEHNGCKYEFMLAPMGEGEY